MGEERVLYDTSADENERLDLVIVTGMSGAGRSRALDALGDFGFFAVDNLPPTMIPEMVKLGKLPGSNLNRIAVASDIRGGEMFGALRTILTNVIDETVRVIVLFLDASDDVLINRFKESRRPHPLEEEMHSLSAAIKKERELLGPLKERSDIVIDTSELRASELRAQVQKKFLKTPVADQLSVTISSFGFKYGQPNDADLVWDVRFLPNPYYDPDLREFSGLDEAVSEFVLERDETKDFLSLFFPLLERVLPAYLAEGKLNLNLALGCTGGRHRSVAISEECGRHLREKGYNVIVLHRDIDREGNH